MSEAVVDDIVAVLPPLLQSLEALGFVARHLHPPEFDRVMQAAGTPDRRCGRCARGSTDGRRNLPTSATPLEAASDAVLAAFDGLRAVQNGQGDLVAVFRALRYAPRAQEALYPLAQNCRRSASSSSIRRCAKTQTLRHGWRSRPNENTGIIHVDNEPGSRGGFSIYVPEYYTPDRALAAGDGAAWRQRQRPRLSVELAARRAQPRRHPDRADRDRAAPGR